MSRPFTLHAAHWLPGPAQTRRQELLDPATWAARWPGCHEVRPLADGHALVILDLPDAPVAGRLLGRLTIWPGQDQDSYRITLALSGPPGGLQAQGTFALAERDDGLSVEVQGQGTVDGRLAALSPRLLETIGRSQLRRALAPLDDQSPEPQHPTKRHAWPSPASAMPGPRPPVWLLGGGLLALWLWHARRRR